jgi:hypothetical protein
MRGTSELAVLQRAKGYYEDSGFEAFCITRLSSLDCSCLAFLIPEALQRLG